MCSDQHDHRSSLPVRSTDLPDFQSWAIVVDPETKEQIRGTPGPVWEDVVDYLSTFFHPLELVEYPSVTTISKWSSKSKFLALSTSSSRNAVQLRTRPSPDGPETSCYTHQLNLLDILDFAIEILPEDAYTLVIFTAHDLYETDEDDSDLNATGPDPTPEPGGGAREGSGGSECECPPAGCGWCIDMLIDIFPFPLPPTNPTLTLVVDAVDDGPVRSGREKNKRSSCSNQ